ncbi:MAG: tRNA-(ms[2]io[6]A)-hydroxylase [Flavobacteriales bacterium]|nr:tRNA-(ms[2]io[6]A)-hydroxylase [Flavobacteriales bacterium]MCB9447868.1 tRNA-(ms[2]io[6]A)-hydroxylase [Flavobacteriales bacterium]
MLGLKLPTDPRWARIAEEKTEDVLTDHAFCEQKAASTAISLIVQYPEYSELVHAMADLAREEMEHFQRVHAIIRERGWVLGKERRDAYVNELAGFIRKGEGRMVALIDRLLFAALIEARSCERFKLLSEVLEDEELKAFYRELMISEAGHYTLFLGFARKYGTPEGMDVDARWQEFLSFEAAVIARYGKSEHIHG